MKGLTFLLLLSILPCGQLPAFASETQEWTGVDESIMERIAKEHGRVAHAPLINTDQGDLLLFVFLFAGFAGWYYGRKLMEQGPETRQREE